MSLSREGSDWIQRELLLAEEFLWMRRAVCR